MCQVPDILEGMAQERQMSRHEIKIPHSFRNSYITVAVMLIDNSVAYSSWCVCGFVYTARYTTIKLKFKTPPPKKNKAKLLMETHERVIKDSNRTVGWLSNIYTCNSN